MAKVKKINFFLGVCLLLWGGDSQASLIMGSPVASPSLNYTEIGINAATADGRDHGVQLGVHLDTQSNKVKVNGKERDSMTSSGFDMMVAGKAPSISGELKYRPSAKENYTEKVNGGNQSYQKEESFLWGNIATNFIFPVGLSYGKIQKINLITQETEERIGPGAVFNVLDIFYFGVAAQYVKSSGSHIEKSYWIEKMAGVSILLKTTTISLRGEINYTTSPAKIEKSSNSNWSSNIHFNTNQYTLVGQCLFPFIDDTRLLLGVSRTIRKELALEGATELSLREQLELTLMVEMWQNSLLLGGSFTMNKLTIGNNKMEESKILLQAGLRP